MKDLNESMGHQSDTVDHVNKSDIELVSLLLADNDYEETDADVFGRRG